MEQSLEPTSPATPTGWTRPPKQSRTWSQNQVDPYTATGWNPAARTKLPAEREHVQENLDVSEGFASRLSQVSQLLLQSPGGSHSPLLQQLPTLWKPKVIEIISKLATLKRDWRWGWYPRHVKSGTLCMMLKYVDTLCNSSTRFTNDVGQSFSKLGINQGSSLLNVLRMSK